MNQYDTPKNKNWLENNLNDEQQKIRLLNNRQEFIIDDKYCCLLYTSRCV